MEKQKTRKRARFLRRAANTLSMSRFGGVCALSAFIVLQEDYHSWEMAGAVATVGMTDKFDGTLGRHAAKLDPEQATKFGANIDQMADKAFVNGTMGTLALKAFMQGNNALGGALSINLAAVTARDWWVTRVRQQADTYGVPGNARWPGKIKAAVQMAALSFAVSPLATAAVEQPLSGQTATVAGITAGTVLSLASGAMLARHLHNGIDATVHSLPLPTETVQPPQQLPKAAN